ncbi:MAG: two-component regulator propeller domain-containing protein, partial [Bacteroidales bacterium]|nr:two-component regulator propeller domain-containing protein [Bacteroidales bacterium]
MNWEIGQALFCLILIITTLFTNCSIAQSYYKVNHFKPEKYQAGNQNWDISLDDNGIVYMANNKGLLVLKGTESKLYEIPTKMILRSVFSHEGRIYTGSFEEFGYWKQEGQENLIYHSLSQNIDPEVISNQEFWKIKLHENKLYFQSFGSLFCLNPETDELIQLETPGSILFLLDCGERLFVQQIGGMLFELIRDEFVPLKNSDILSATEVKTAVWLSPREILFGTSSMGLFVFDDSSIKPFQSEANELLKTGTLNNGMSIGNRLIFGTIAQGLFVLRKDGTIENHLNGPNVLQNNTILSLASDQDDNLWVGLDKGIDFIWFGSPFENYLAPDIDIGSVYAAALYKNQLYIGTNQGIYTFQLNKSGTFDQAKFVNNSQGLVWFIRVI